jgi:Kef-type K+ transport system membrane component KefB
MVAILALVGGAAYFLLPRVAAWADRLRASQGLLAIVLAAVLLLAWSVESLGGVAAITGAFLAGVGLGRSHLRHEIERGLSPLAYAFFVPLFLVDIGLQSNARDLPGAAVWLALALIAVAAISKLVGSGLGARAGGFESGPAIRMGIGMISRGEVGLIVAGVIVAEGILDPEIFTVVVLMVLATTILTPPLLRWAFAREEVRDAAAD